jgi:DNA-binding NtrC family response regulator
LSRPADIISWVIDWMLANEDSITQELALRCELEARAEWGGQRIEYVAKTPRRATPGQEARRRAEDQALQSVVAGGQSVRRAAEMHGVPRTTLQRKLSVTRRFSGD